MQDSKEFINKIHKKNILRKQLRHKEKLYDEIRDNPNLEFTSKQLLKEINEIRSELNLHD